MLNRRDFLTGFVGTGITLGITNLDAATSIASLCDTSSKPLSVQINPMRKKRIFCQFDNQILEATAKKCAKGVYWEVLYGEPFSPDIVILNGFINIIDRNLVGKKWWDEYVRCLNEYGWDELCLIVDNNKGWALPQKQCVLQYDLDDPASIREIDITICENIMIHLLEEEKTRLCHS